jgi:hypothetical protein
MLKFSVANFHMSNAQLERENRICCVHAKKYMAQYIKKKWRRWWEWGGLVEVVTVAVAVAATMMVNKYNIAYH